VQCRIRWSGGLQQDLAPLAAGHLYVVHEGKEASRLH
jgi:hypothetical protein